MPTQLRFPTVRLSPEVESLRLEVREFLASERRAGTWGDAVQSWGGHNPELSRKIGERGWIGMTWPKQYGGGERTYLERYVYTEELLAAGAPAGAHWVADRQSGPLFLRFGSEEQKQRFLPPITRGEAYYSIGMSEPDAGSDLASIRSRAERDGDGWRLTGTKIWTSGAHLNHWMIALVRTEPLGADRHAGMSQFVVDLASEGLTVRPIRNLAGDEGFNEVVMDRVFVPHDRLLGEPGAGWRQVTSELAYERAGPERFLTNLHLLSGLLDLVGEEATRDVRARIGRAASHLWTLRQMSLGVASMLSEGVLPNMEAALVKDLGTHFQQQLPEIAREVLDALPASAVRGARGMRAEEVVGTTAAASAVRGARGMRAEEVVGTTAAASDRTRAYRGVLERGILAAPAYTIQGGTTEILRGIIARGLGLR